ncbi:MAG: protein-methionine-sulfoxide reductase catalytic subunit MsrP [Dechloromonas sp.]|nr:protein-methionine-sulfoxide reductase catalytic subunit MsrP [Dechloromonas sp.]
MPRFKLSLPAPSEITTQSIFSQRRRLLVAGASTLALAATPPAWASPNPRLSGRPSPMSSDEKPTSAQQVSSYCNFYEFGPDKDSPSRHAHRLQTHPWQVSVDGEVKRPRTFGIDDLLKLAPLEERIYRFRCVEGWSAVIPWIGWPLASLLKQVEPTGNARFVEFTSLADAEQMPYIRLPLLDWPYVEGLRLDEAMNPLTLLAFGMYGEVLPKQNGAPLRLIVPWKYGFKGSKSIVRIRFVEKQPSTAWMKANPDEYGFYSNVNPAVPHKRWLQSHERRLGEFFKRPTQPFNGYAEQVAHLYAGMDLQRNF